MNNQADYRKLPKHTGVFNSPIWLDLVCGPSGWDVLKIQYKNKLGYLPYRTLGNGAITPGLSGYTLLLDQSGNEQTDNNVLVSLARELRKINLYNLKIMTKDFAPFVWEKLKPTPKCTYVIRKKTPEELFRDYDTDLRNRIRKSEKAGVLITQNDASEIDTFLETLFENFAQKKLTLPFEKEKMKKIISSTINSSGTLLIAKSPSEFLGGIYLHSDEQRTCYLLGCCNEKGRKLQVSSYLIHQGILKTLDSGKIFDFEGSSIYTIASYFRDFGGTLEPVWWILKKGSILERMKNRLSKK